MLKEMHHLIWATSAEGYNRFVSENNAFLQVKTTNMAQ